MRNIIVTITIALLLQPFTLLSQSETTTWQQYKKLSRPEKYWVVKHVFVAKKAWKITRDARLQTDSIEKTSMLDGDPNGGKVDAFRHAFWMASLSQKMRWKKAYRLGKAHEKGNYIDYKKHRQEDGTFPDKISSTMDLWNNDIGLQIGRNNRNISTDSLKMIVVEYILKGEMKIIKKNNLSQYLDTDGNIIPDEVLKGKWENSKILIPSNSE